MSTLAQRRMTVDEFLVWADGRQGRWELHNGVPYAMPAERTRHAKVKFAVQLALQLAIRKGGLLCHMLPDGPGVRISEQVMYEPDALVYCGPELPGHVMEVPNPVIVVEVASPSTRKFDASTKLKDYFSLPSLHHYLIVDPEGAPAIHHHRRPDGQDLPFIVHEGVLTLTPPGVELAVPEIFGST
jgi:Uma2 family endonuclease